jgi:hypothetical protein
MRLQLRFSQEGQDKDKRIAIAKKTLQEGKMSLKGVLKSTIEDYLQNTPGQGETVEGEYSSLKQNNSNPPPAMIEVLKEILHDAFVAYDTDKNGTLEKSEVKVFLKDFNENIDDDEIEELRLKIDANSDDKISFDEFIVMAYNFIMYSHVRDANDDDNLQQPSNAEVVESIFNDGDDGEEEEEIPEDFTDLSPEEQQKAIKLRAFKMLSIGTVMVIYFSDPMVDVMQEIAARAGISPFYVSFVLAPLASNASEVVASMFYAAKKTRKTMAVSLSALEGAACMNNTFWYV